MAIRILLLRILPALCAAALFPSLHAATFTVDSDQDLVDAVPGDGSCDVGIAVPPGDPRCTLRAAVMEAEANGEPDTLVVSPGLQIDLTLSGTGGAEVGDLEVTTDISILGFAGATPPQNAADLPLIDASAIGDHIFRVEQGRLLLRGLRLTGANSQFFAGAIAGFGDANSLIDVQHCVFSNNVSISRGGAISGFESIRLNVADSHFLRNDAPGTAQFLGFGAAIHVEGDVVASIDRSSFVDNRDSSSQGATISVHANASLRLENSTLDGSLVAPVISGRSARRGVTRLGDGQLIIRNTTISNFSTGALLLGELDDGDYVRVAHSILAGSSSACEAGGPAPLAADIQMAYSMIQSQTGCAPYYGVGISPRAPELAPPAFDAPPRVTVSRVPTGPLSNVVDAGIDASQAPSDPAFSCTDTDQREQPRLQDADLDEALRCDLGAIEQSPPVPIVVDHFADDLIDALPGDGLCASADTPGVGVVCTLRAAVMEANARPGLDHILFEPSETPAVLTRPSNVPNGGALSITETVAIDGQLEDGRPVTTVEGQNTADRLFLVDTPDEPVYLRNLRLTGGGPDGSAQAGGALAILPDSTVELHRSELFGNAASAGGGAIAISGGRLRAIDTDFQGNTSVNGSLAIDVGVEGTLDLSRSSLRDHLGVDSSGTPQPAIRVEPGANLFLSDSTISGNQRALIADQPDVVFLDHMTLIDQIDGTMIVTLGASSQLFAINNIVAAPTSTAIDCVIDGSALAAFFAIESILDSDGSCAAFADFNGLTGDPLLLPIGRPGGRISYSRAPSATPEAPSPALDVGSTEDCGALDQYGLARAIDFDEIADLDGPCDLGAVEARAFDSVFRDSFEAPE